MKPAPALCPSAPGEPGAKLIGIAGEDGRVNRLRNSIPVTEAFLAKAASAGPIGARFRFSAPCAEGGCSQWADGACGLGAKLRARAEGLDMPAADAGLAPCDIRGDCRWWQQDGAAACRICPLVIYDAGKT